LQNLQKNLVSQDSEFQTEKLILTIVDEKKTEMLRILSFSRMATLGIRRALNENTKTKHLTRAKSASDLNYSIEKDATIKLLCICAARKMSMTMTDAFVGLQ
jgi:hypothetical protein